MTSQNRRWATPPKTSFGMSYPAYVVLALVLGILTGCREPMSMERFVAGEGPYAFFVPMTDSAATYDFDFYTRVDAPRDSLAGRAALPLTVTWTSPTLHVFQEDVYLPLEGRSTYFSREIRAPYRAGIRPDEYGQWVLSVRVSDPPEGLRGMGLVVKRNK